MVARLKLQPSAQGCKGQTQLESGNASQVLVIAAE